MSSCFVWGGRCSEQALRKVGGVENVWQQWKFLLIDTIVTTDKGAGLSVFRRAFDMQGGEIPCRAPLRGWHELDIAVADDFLRRESDQREDGLRRAAFHPEEFNRLKYTGRG
ncbi:MAG: hypothetical protein ACQESR_04665 [Planctomycetota bacterium]